MTGGRWRGRGARRRGGGRRRRLGGCGRVLPRVSTFAVGGPAGGGSQKKAWGARSTMKRRSILGQDLGHAYGMGAPPQAGRPGPVASPRRRPESHPAPPDVRGSYLQMRWLPRSGRTRSTRPEFVRLRFRVRDQGVPPMSPAACVGNLERGADARSASAERHVPFAMHDSGGSSGHQHPHDRSKGLRAPLEDPRRDVAQPRDHRARQHDPQRRPPEPARALRRIELDACSGSSTPTCSSSPACS